MEGADLLVPGVGADGLDSLQVKAYAKKVVVITDNLVPYPLQDWSIPEIYVDCVVQVEAIGDPKGIVSDHVEHVVAVSQVVVEGDGHAVLQSGEGHSLPEGTYQLAHTCSSLPRPISLAAAMVCSARATIGIRNGVVTAIQTDYMAAGLGREISRGLMEKPVQFRTHGGRPSAIAGGETTIDVAFIAAPSADPMGNCTGKFGKSASPRSAWRDWRSGGR